MEFRIELVRSRTVYDYAEIIVDAASSSEAWGEANDLALAEDGIEWALGDMEDTNIEINAVTGA
jgi:hypothetical protein